MLHKDKSLNWLKRDIKDNYKAIKILRRRYHDGSDIELEQFDTLMHKLVDQVKKMEYELDERMGKLCR